MGIMQMVIGAGALEEQNYWYANIGGSSPDGGKGIGVDSSGNVYTVGRSESSGASDLYIAKHDKDGALEWQKALGIGGYIKCCVVDSDGNIYSSGNTSSNSPQYGGQDIITTKHNSSGTLLWQRQIGGSGGDQAVGIGLDSSDNVYLTGELQGSGSIGTRDTPFIKYNSSGVLQFQKSYGISGEYFFVVGNAVALDSSDNIYLVVSDNSGGPSGQNEIMKINSSGTIQWNKTILSATSTDRVQVGQVAVDSSDNIYFALHNDTEKTFVLLKYNSSDNLVWQREITGTPSGMGDINSVDGIKTDSDGNIYVVCEHGTSPKGPIIFKWNSSGTLVWQRRWIHVGGTSETQNVNGSRITTLKAHSFYVTAEAAHGPQGSADIITVKLPADGTLTGTHGDFNYESISYTEGAGAYTESSTTTTVSHQTTSLTAADASFTTNTPSLTNTTTVID